jgi:hypothetical protein
MVLHLVGSVCMIGRLFATIILMVVTTTPLPTESMSQTCIENGCKTYLSLIQHPQYPELSSPSFICGTNAGGCFSWHAIGNVTNNLAIPIKSIEITTTLSCLNGYRETVIANALLPVVAPNQTVPVYGYVRNPSIPCYLNGWNLVKADKESIVQYEALEVVITTTSFLTQPITSTVFVHNTSSTWLTNVVVLMVTKYSSNGGKASLYDYEHELKGLTKNNLSVW